MQDGAGRLLQSIRKRKWNLQPSAGLSLLHYSSMVKEALEGIARS
jgi:hypothetical protein